MRTPLAPGSISAFFLYQGVEGGNDEIDIELFNDGSRRILFTTWAAGVETNTATHELPFDPASALHLYEIGWLPDAVRFGVDGVMMREFRTGIPRSEMWGMANAWWPAWLDGPLLDSSVALEVRGIETVPRNGRSAALKPGA